MKRPLLTFTLMLLLATPCMSAVLNVPSQFSTIQEAFDSAQWRDTVEISPGTYTGPGFWDIQASYSYTYVMSSTTPDSTIIELQGHDFMSLGSVGLEGITFRNGARVCISGGPIKSCQFENCQLAIKYHSYGILRIYNSSFVGNDTGLYVDGLIECTLYSCVFMNNRMAVLVDYTEGFLTYDGLFAYNDTVVKALRSLAMQDLGGVYYNNESLGNDPLLFGAGPTCQVVWPQTSHPNGKTKSLSSVNGTTIFENPRFCDTTLLTSADVDLLSPCLPENNVCGIALGTVSVGCSCCNDDTRGNVDYIIGPAGPIDVSDLTYIVAYLFQGGPEPPCLDAANVDGLIGPGGPVDVSDLTYLVAYLFKGGPTPPTCP